MMFGIETCSSRLKFSIYFMSRKTHALQACALLLNSTMATYSNSHK